MTLEQWRARVDEIDEASPLDDATARDIEARDDAAPDRHGRPPARESAARPTKFAMMRRPARPLRSGWNWTPRTLPLATALTNLPPCSVVARATSATSGAGRTTYEWTK